MSKPKPKTHHLDKRAAQLLAAGPPGVPPPADDDTLLNTAELAAWLGVSEVWLEIGRVRGYGPKYVPLGPRRIVYRIGDVRAYLRERAHAYAHRRARAAAAKAIKSPRSKNQPHGQHHVRRQQEAP